MSVFSTREKQPSLTMSQEVSLLTAQNLALLLKPGKALDYEHGNFMQTILAETDFLTYAFFTTPDLYSISFLSLVVKGESPGDDIYLNGISLGSLDWTTISGFSSAEMLLDHGMYILDSVDGRPFAAYVYQHTRFITGGVGYALLPVGLFPTPPTPEPTFEPSTPPTTPHPNYEYAAACLPTSRGSIENCYIQLLSNATANVEIHSISDSESFSLPAGEVYQREYEDFPDMGVESKAIRISSDIAIQVLVYKMWEQALYDVYMVPNQIGDRLSYFTIPDTWTTGSTYYSQFYLVTSFYDNTSVNITQQDGTAYYLDLSSVWDIHAENPVH